LKLIVNYIYNLALTPRGINIIESDFDWNEYIEYFIPGDSIYRILTSRIATFFFAWGFVPIEINCKLYIYNLALKRRGINIIESDFDWNEYIEYFIPDHSI
jgi:hypothetical protein